jgi:hypothetical protein
MARKSRRLTSSTQVVVPPERLVPSVEDGGKYVRHVDGVAPWTRGHLWVGIETERCSDG